MFCISAKLVSTTPKLLAWGYTLRALTFASSAPIVPGVAGDSAMRSSRRERTRKDHEQSDRHVWRGCLENWSICTMYGVFNIMILENPGEIPVRKEI
jgi:hypothetical protein